MAIEVKFRGVPQSERTWYGICWDCKSIVECKKGDLLLYNGGDYRSDGPYGTIRCPVCTSVISMHIKKDD